MKKIGLFYAPPRGSVEKVVKQITEIYGSENIDVVLVNEETKPEALNDYDKIILGISTVGRHNWDASYTKIGWDFFLSKVKAADLSNKTIALFGLGDHITYSDTYVEALGELGRIIMKSKAKLVGKVAVNKYEEYQHIDSEGVVDGWFPGLPLDEDHLSDLTEIRLKEWFEEIKTDFGL